MFSPKSQIPCVGISFGIDRIFAITKMRLQADKNAEKLRKNDVDVYVMAFGGGKDFTGFLKERSEICSRLWKAGIKVSSAHRHSDHPLVHARASFAQRGIRLLLCLSICMLTFLVG